MCFAQPRRFEQVANFGLSHVQVTKEHESRSGGDVGPGHERSQLHRPPRSTVKPWRKVYSSDHHLRCVQRHPREDSWDAFHVGQHLHFQLKPRV